MSICVVMWDFVFLVFIDYHFHILIIVIIIITCSYKRCQKCFTVEQNKVRCIRASIFESTKQVVLSAFFFLL